MPKLNYKKQDGAVATLFAILLGSGVLVSIVAMAVNAGHVALREQTDRDSAAAVAEAVAIVCAKSLPGGSCSGNPIDYSGLNPGQDSADVCGYSKSVAVNPCTVESQPGQCQTNSTTQGNWIRATVGRACSEVTWGIADSISVDTTGKQIPFALGACEAILPAAPTKVQLIGQASSAPCQGLDRSGADLAASGRGFIQFDPTSASHACWTLNSTCKPVALETTRNQSSLSNPVGSYSGLIAALKSSINHPVTLPVFDVKTSGTAIEGFAGFTLSAFKFPTSSKVSACSANSACSVSSSATHAWIGPCAAAQSASSAFCIAGLFQPRVVGAYGQVPGVQIAPDGTTNFGYEVIRRVG
ncbi:MAG: hypothetical protein RJA35_1273 [Actinomycetota bacterium]|jgi:hypothetical protein